MWDAVAGVVRQIREKRAGFGLTVAIVGVASLGLEGCKLFIKDEPPPCPRVSILADASNLVRFHQGAKADAKNIDITAKLVSYAGSCGYDADEKQMSVALTVGFDVTRGPAAGELAQEISYFVAVPAYYPQTSAKRVLSFPVELPKDNETLHVTDKEIQISFPVNDIKELERYEIFVGIQLNQAELDYNRNYHPH
jgi:hypothetical protein